jgi:hypothetical protein
MTGITVLAADLDGKRQEILIEAVPGIRGMAALCDPKTTTDAQLHALQEAAHARNIELSIHRIVRAEDVAAAIDIAKTSGATALNILASPFLCGWLGLTPWKTCTSYPLPAFLAHSAWGHERRFRNIREESAHTPTTDVKPSGDDRR